MIPNPYTGEKCDVSDFGESPAAAARAFHAGFPGYAPTPLVSLSALAGRLGTGNIYIKDESKRFDLNAFKVLGGSFAIGSLIAEELGETLPALPYDRLTGAELRERLGEMTFITATDGNHGRGVAWTAARLHQRGVVYMPEGTAAERLENIRRLGAEARVTDPSYDEAVRRAAADAAKNGWLLIQDTSLPGYERVPRLIMQGYLTMVSEAVEQLGSVRPTHVFLQAGVGSMAAAVTAFLATRYRENKPVTVIVEPHTADCVFRTARANDGTLHAAEGKMKTVMAGLACGEVCAPAWRILQSHADFFGTMDDETAENAMRVLAHPRGNDPAVTSGESGAAGLGFALALLEREEYRAERERLGLNERSVLLCFSTEGATDRENYRRITGLSL